MSLNCPLLILTEKVDLAYFMISFITHLVEAAEGVASKTNAWGAQGVLPLYNP